MLFRSSVGVDRKEAIAAVAIELDLPKREVFDAMVANKANLSEG